MRSDGFEHNHGDDLAGSLALIHGELGPFLSLFGPDSVVFGPFGHAGYNGY